ncbi:hypothetical protein CSC14_2398 [Proteus mirabilis]|nr:hypothetical protein HMPREF3203_00989 [Proteus mirabilis]PVF73007.1 hypothetical protein CSC14_2398 [Proteus mirabilis]
MTQYEAPNNTPHIGVSLLLPVFNLLSFGLFINNDRFKSNNCTL